MAYCPSCGHQIDDYVLYCPSCGAKVSSAQVSIPPPPMPGPPAPYSPYYMPSEAGFGDADKYALNKLKIFALVTLAGVIAGFALTFGSGLFVINFVSGQNFLEILAVV